MKGLFGQQGSQGMTGPQAGSGGKATRLLIGLLFFSAGLLIGLALSFPGAALEKRLLAEAENRGRVKISARHLELWPPHRMRGTDLTIQPTTGNWPPIRLNSLEITPAWLSLLSLNPTLRCRVEAMHGELLAEFRRDGSMSMTASNLSLDLPVRADSQLRLSGRLVQARGHGSLPLRRDTGSELALHLSNVTLRGMEGRQQDIALGDISVHITGTGTTFAMDSLAAEGGQFAVKGNGRLLLNQQHAPASRFSLQARIVPADTTDPLLVGLLELVARPTAAGHHELKLGGTLAHPVVQ
ncbi:MAG: type II secretion system protein GspN [Desulfobulbaceae bacterium]|nr:MAG: type II secretion system protein GspN [Desulfobulbaceae bacterium]